MEEEKYKSGKDKNKVSIYNKLYLEANKEKINKRKKKYRETNKEKITKYAKDYYINNLEKERERGRKYYKENPDVARNNALKRKYNITLEDYNILLQEQNNCCKICKKEEIALDNNRNNIKPLAVDHCHNTGKVRSLLCSKCNIAIGLVNEDIDLLTIMIEYIKFYN